MYFISDEHDTNPFPRLHLRMLRYVSQRLRSFLQECLYDDLYVGIGSGAVIALLKKRKVLNVKDFIW